MRTRRRCSFKKRKKLIARRKQGSLVVCEDKICIANGQQWLLPCDTKYAKHPNGLQAKAVD